MYPTDFEAKTSHLTLEEDGAYNRLLRLMWMTPGCSLPDDDAWIMRRMRVDADTYGRVVRVVIDEFCTRENGRVSNPKLARISAETNAAHKRRVAAGSVGGKAKALKTKTKKPSNALAMPKQPEPEPELELDTKKDTSNDVSKESDETEPENDDGKPDEPAEPVDAGPGEYPPKPDDPPAPKPKPKRTATAKCGLDGNWEPDQGAIAYAETRGLDWQQTWEDFRDYHIAHGSKWAGDKGWNASWQRWCRNAAERAAKAASRQNQQPRANGAGQGNRPNDPWHEAILVRRAAGVGQFGEEIPKAGDGQPDGEGCEVLPFGDWFRDDGTR